MPSGYGVVPLTIHIQTYKHHIDVRCHTHTWAAVGVGGASGLTQTEAGLRAQGCLRRLWRTDDDDRATDTRRTRYGTPPLGSPYPSECPSLPSGRSGIIIAPRCWRTAPAGSGDVSRRSPFPLDAGCSQLSPALRSFAPFLLITRGVDTESHAQAREKRR